MAGNGKGWLRMAVDGFRGFIETMSGKDVWKHLPERTDIALPPLHDLEPWELQNCFIPVFDDLPNGLDLLDLLERCCPVGKARILFPPGVVRPDDDHLRRVGNKVSGELFGKLSSEQTTPSTDEKMSRVVKP